MFCINFSVGVQYIFKNIYIFQNEKSKLYFQKSKI